MNAAQLQKTLRASQYTEQVLANHQSLLEQDYALISFKAHSVGNILISW